MNASAKKTAKVQLTRKHVHAGIEYVKDEIIEVAEHLVAWFEKQEIGKRYTGTEPAKNATKN